MLARLAMTAAVSGFGLVGASCRPPCLVPSQTCELASRADKELSCPNLVNGGLHQDASVRHHLAVEGGDRYTMCCGAHYGQQCADYFCPTGKPVSACVRE